MAAAALNQADYAAIAQCVVALLSEQRPATATAPRWATTEQLCQELNISADYARAHKAELGAVTLPSTAGGRGTLRWDMNAARAWFDSLRVSRVVGADVGELGATADPEAPARTKLTPRPYAIP